MAAAQSEMTPAGLEPAIPGSVGRCLIHWATGPTGNAGGCVNYSHAIDLPQHLTNARAGGTDASTKRLHVGAPRGGMGPSFSCHSKRRAHQTQDNVQDVRRHADAFYAARPM